MTQDEGDMMPFRPCWPLLVSEDTKRELLDQLAEVVHTPRPVGPEGAFARGFETGMASVMLTLGINEAASPERRSLPVSADHEAAEKGALEARAPQGGHDQHEQRAE